MKAAQQSVRQHGERGAAGLRKAGRAGRKPLLDATQFTGAQVEVRTTADFHDRFYAIDSCDFYHVGASVKDAEGFGKRAFFVSRLQDQPIIAALKQYLDQAWNEATAVDLS